MTEAPADNAAQITYWNETAAVPWVRFQASLDAIFTPLAQAAVAAAAPVAGERVIDVGCGCGATVLELAKHAGPSGHVLGVDVSAPMAERARQRIAEHGFRQAEVLVSDAAAHAFAPADADLLFSRLGVMFFADPTTAFVNLRKAMRTSGRLLFACWRPLSENQWFTLPIQSAQALLPPQPPPEPDAPGPFAFADADRVKGILTASGWRDISIQQQDLPMRLAGPHELEAATDFTTRVGPLSRLLAEADDAVRTKARQAVTDALRPYDSPDGVILGGSVWLVFARP